MDTKDVICNWRFRADRVQQAHYLAGRRYERFNRYLGAPSTVLMAIVGTTIFANLSDNSSGLSVGWQITIGIISVLAAVLSSLQTFLGFSELGEKHRIAGARFANLKQKLELLECYLKDDTQDKLEAIEVEWSSLREESPNLPQTVWLGVKETLTYEVHSKKYVKNA
jgi:hypothetical protein